MVSGRHSFFILCEAAVIIAYFLVKPEYKAYAVPLAVVILFVWFSFSLFLSSIRNEQTVLSYDLMSTRYARTMLDAYREIVGYRITSVMSIVFFAIFIFVKLHEEPNLSNVLEVLLIFGGVISLQIYHLLDLINHEPEIHDVDEFLKPDIYPKYSKQVKLEGIINGVESSVYQDFELISFELVSPLARGKTPITYVHRAISAAPQILEGSRIRLHGDFFFKSEDVPFSLRDFNLDYPRIIVVEGYGTVEEIAFLYDETAFQREYKAGSITFNFNSVEDITKNSSAMLEIVKNTEIGKAYTTDQLIELGTNTPDQVRKYMQLLVDQGYFEIVEESQFGYMRIKRNKK